MQMQPPLQNQIMQSQASKQNIGSQMQQPVQNTMVQPQLPGQMNVMTGKANVYWLGGIEGDVNEIMNK